MSSLPIKRSIIIRELKKALKRSQCSRKKVACIAVKNHKIIARGWSIPPNPTLCTGGYQKLRLSDKAFKTFHNCLHAEWVMIRYAKHSLEGSQVFVTSSCCPGCLSALTHEGVEKVYYVDSYNRVYPAQVYEQLIPMIKMGIDSLE